MADKSISLSSMGALTATYPEGGNFNICKGQKVVGLKAIEVISTE